MSRLKAIIEGHETRQARYFDFLIQALIVLSIVSSSIATLPDLSERTRAVLSWIEVGTVAVFTVEYLLRILVADNRLRFITSFYGIVDFVAIAPFYLFTGLDLRSVRAVRLVHLFRTFKLIRYSEALQRFNRALVDSREELVLFLLIAVLMLFFSATGIYYFEKEAQPEEFASVFHALWWAVATLSTVGYGDIYPVTVGGRIFTFFVLIVGLGVVAVPTAILSSAFTKARRRRSDDP